MADQYDLTIDQGATYQDVTEWVDEAGAPIDLTGFVARMQVRASPEDLDTILDLSDAGGEIVIDGPNGKIALTIDADTTAALTPGRYRYDLEVESPGGTVTRLRQGFCTVDPEVTR